MSLWYPAHMESADRDSVEATPWEELLRELQHIYTELQSLKQTIESLDSRLTSALDSLRQLRPDANGAQTDGGTNQTHDELGHLTALEWLRLRGIAVRHESPPDYDYSALDHLSKLLGEHRKDVRRVFDAIRAALSDKGIIRVDLSRASQEELSYSTQMCTIMRDHALLREYHYAKGRRLVLGNVLREGYIINYLTGKWFERFVHLKVSALLQAHSLQADLLVNPKIIFPNGDDFELDLFWTVDSTPLWIECKTGDYSEHVVKYAKVRKSLHVPAERSILVVYGLDDWRCNSLTKLHGINITNEVGLSDVVRRCLGLAPVNAQVGG